MLHKSLILGLVLLAGLVSATIERSEPVRETSEASRSKRWWGGYGLGLGGWGLGGLYGGFGYPYGGLGFWGKRDVEEKRDMHPIDMEHSKMKRDLDTMHKTSELIKEREADASRSKRWFGLGGLGYGGLYGGWGLGGFGYPYGLGYWGKKRSTEERDTDLKREDIAEIEKQNEMLNEKRLIEKESFRAEQIHHMNKRAIEETEIAKKDSTRSKRWFGLGGLGLYGGLGGFGGYPYYGGFWKRDASEHIKEDSERSVDDDIVKRDVEERDTDVIEEPEIKTEDHVEPSEDRERRWYVGGYRGFYGGRGFGGYGGYGRYRYFG